MPQHTTHVSRVLQLKTKRDGIFAERERERHVKHCKTLPLWRHKQNRTSFVECAPIFTVDSIQFLLTSYFQGAVSAHCSRLGSPKLWLQQDGTVPHRAIWALSQRKRKFQDRVRRVHQSWWSSGTDSCHFMLFQNFKCLYIFFTLA